MDDITLILKTGLFDNALDDLLIEAVGKNERIDLNSLASDHDWDRALEQILAADQVISL